MKTHFIYAAAYIALGILLGFVLHAFIVRNDYQKPQCQFDYHLNYSVEGEGIIIYAKDGDRFVGAVDYKDAGLVDRLLKLDIYGTNKMPQPKPLN